MPARSNCHGVHTATAERLDAEACALARLVEGAETTAIPERMKPILFYAEKLTRTPDGLASADAEAVFAAGWDETARHHAVAVSALFNFVNRLVEGLGIELDPAYIGPAPDRLAKRGYLPLIKMMEGAHGLSGANALVQRQRSVELSRLAWRVFSGQCG